MKQTAVEWLVKKIIEMDGQEISYRTITVELVDQAKEMEKQQIIDAFYQCGRDNFEHIKVINRSATEYYNETYGSKGSDEIEKSEKPINLTSSQTEISDEEIEKAAYKYAEVYQCPTEIKMCKHDIVSAWNKAIQWYREQLKSRGNGNK